MLLKDDNPELCFHYFYRAFSHLLTVDNIMHVELRMIWRVENESKPGTRERIILNALEAANKDCGASTNLTLKTIWSDSRSFGNGCNGKEKNITDDIIYVGKQVKNPGNHHLIGYDLVSEEENGKCNYYLLKDISTAYSQLEGYLPPFFWHDGESELPPDYDPHNRNHSKYPRDLYFNNNLIDAYLMNSRPFQRRMGRVGHGIELFKTPALLNQYRAAGLHIELCPVSNQFLKYMKDLGEHPGQAYLAAGIPVSLSPDDPALFSYQGVSIDFWEACIAWDIDLKILKVLAYYSLKYSGLSPREKDAAVKKWKFLWDEFIKEQITETIP
jgi:adenosine deaminase CECR1